MIKETDYGDHALSPSTGEAEAVTTRLVYKQFQASQGHNGTLSKRKSCISFEVFRKL